MFRFALALISAAAAAAAATRVTLSNTRLPVDTDGNTMITGEIQIFNNIERDGYYYVYETNWGCCRQVDCCTSSKPWPQGDCWQCCPAQVHSPCTYAQNHTIQAYRTRDFTSWENLGALITPAMKHAGSMFVPRVVYSARDDRYVMWFARHDSKMRHNKNGTVRRG